MDDASSTAETTSGSDDGAPNGAMIISMDWMDCSGHDGHEHSSYFLDDIDHGQEEVAVMLSSGVALEELRHDDEERGGLLHEDFNATCRLAARLGAAFVS